MFEELGGFVEGSPDPGVRLGEQSRTANDYARTRDSSDDTNGWRG
jgi:hypothetical protein